MPALRHTVAVVMLFSAASSATAEELAETAMFQVSAPGGWVLGSDQTTLVVSQPRSAELVYFNTALDEESRRVALDFAPGVMALAGDRLFVAGDGAATVHELDFQSGETKREFTVPGTGITDLACVRGGDVVYAATSTYEIFMIDTKTRKVADTGAVGNRIRIAPTSERTIYTGVLRNDVTDVFLITAGHRGQIRIIYDRWGPRSGILKYMVAGRKLQFEDVQDNATVNAYQLIVTPDGKQAMMTGGGGWRPPADAPGAGGGYYTAVFSADNLVSLVGKAPMGVNLAFHPDLRLAVANQVGRDLQLFDPRTFVEKERIHLADGADMRPLLLTFVAKGTKIAVWNGDNPQNPREGLHLLPLPMTDADRETLVQKYGELPTVKLAARTEDTTPLTPPSVPDEPDEADGPDRPSRVHAAGALALAGFNDRKGLGKSRKAGFPYRLGVSNQPGGYSEPGWSGPWPALEKANFQKDVVYEGDGALWLEGTANYARAFSRPLSGRVEIEQYVRIPAGSQMSCYVWETNYTQTGPMWHVMDGDFEFLDGDENGRDKWGDSGVIVDPEKWYRVVMRIDLAKRRWRFLLPEQEFASGELGFRGRPQRLLHLNYLTEKPEGVYIDAIQLRSFTADD